MKLNAQTAGATDLRGEGRQHRAGEVKPTQTGQRRVVSLGLLMALLAGCGGSGAGGAPALPATTYPALRAADLAVLVAEGDATSEAIALAYQQARGIPEANMIRVAVPQATDALTAADFAAVKSAIDARLPVGVQALLVTWSKPSRVHDSCSMGLTSALAFGYEARYCGGCVSTRASGYYDSDSGQPWTDHGLRPAMMLGASTLAEAQALIARGLASEASLTRGGASGQAWLVRTSDAGRSVRSDDFRSLAATRVPGVTMHYVDNAAGTGNNAVANQRNVLFYFTGLASVPDIATNTYLPGAVADHLTSSGGYLPDGGGQMPATAWLRAGVTGSFGTVEEPCNFAQKFPRASVLVKHYARGNTLIEAYWKSVQWPGQGLFLGDPLARPWAP
ncbi:MAG: TIGR03790 family protein [Rubrivivax sp.]|nr:TIGR03790 family protein [Rubrivivax sp.]